MQMKSIRRATPADQIVAGRIYRDVVSSAHWLPAASRSQTDFAAASVGEEVFVCCDAENVSQGFVAVWRPDAFSHHLYVDSRFRNQGVGTLLLDSLEGWLPRPWTLKCANANRAAIAFYLARGWRWIDTGENEHGQYSVLESVAPRSA
ncbi:Acetyltransferase (GNAT) family protein [Rosistilla ulvae]|uniref:Acetyltransferase (GNAT) family protein n=1 Tax=Rosistilla ulvae TaxID=1930277 RepID=A0A517LZ49_9BACT|nr:GNAT family N-acetyltransferase [Rosistilla ulvae]QDS87903.1 Acetyltransferase (GNAT) family protein [Rosistilla ulvae]